jgi:hypothetical protein
LKEHGKRISAGRAQSSYGIQTPRKKKLLKTKGKMEEPIVRFASEQRTECPYLVKKSYPHCTIPLIINI